MPQYHYFGTYSKLGGSHRAEERRFAVAAFLIAIVSLILLRIVNLSGKHVTLDDCLLVPQLVAALPWSPATFRDIIFSGISIIYLASLMFMFIALDNLVFDFFAKGGEGYWNKPTTFVLMIPALYCA